MNETLQLPTDEYTAAFSHAGCPICQLRDERERRFIETVLNDWVIAAMVRATFIDALGYCPTHAWLQQATEWQSQRDGMTTADMYRYLLSWNLDGLEMFTWWSRYRLKFGQLWPFDRLDHHNGSDKKLDQPQAAYHRRMNLPAGLTVRGQCPICEVGQQTERFRLRQFGERLASPDFQSSYAASDGLCLLHLTQALEAIHQPELRQFLLCAAMEKLAATTAKLSDLSKQSDVVRSSQLRRTYARAITQLVGGRVAMSSSDAPIDSGRSFEAALALEACPVCGFAAAARQTYLEQVLCAASLEGELCHDHLWQLYDVASAQPNHIGLATQLSERLNRVRQQLATWATQSQNDVDQANSRWPNRIRQLIKIRAVRSMRHSDASESPACPVCQREADAQEQSLADFLQQLQAVEIQQRYARSQWLCLPHLRAALKTGAPLRCRIFLAEAARDRLTRLIHHVEEYERKHIWNYRDEPKLAEEQVSWIRAVAFEVGDQLWVWNNSPILSHRSTN